MSTGPKAAAFAVMLRVLFATTSTGWYPLIWVSAALSMTIGNFGALMQNNVKAHAGLFVHCTRWISFSGVRGAKRPRHVGGDVLHGNLRGHERGRIRRNQPHRLHRRTLRHRGRLCRARPTLSVAGVHAYCLSAVAHRNPCNGLFWASITSSPRLSPDMQVR